MHTIKAIALLVFCICVQSDAKRYVRVCYYTNWAQYRPGHGKFLPSNIDPHLCTHIIIAFAKISNGILAECEWNDDEMFSRIVSLKEQNKNLKILLAVGGWNHENYGSPFSNMVNEPGTRKIFIDSVVKLLREHNFDGLDLDWEYPADRGSPPDDRKKFVDFCEQLQVAFKKDPENELLITAAVAAGVKKIPISYDAKRLSNCVDFINLMAYDLHGSWDKKTGHQTSLPEVEEAVDTWIEQGMSPGKIALGLGMYGRSFTLSGDRNDLEAPTKDPGTPGPVTRAKGFLAYYEICSLMKSNAISVNAKAVGGPYVYHGSLWVSYDDKQSLGKKVDLIEKKGLKGAMFWALDLDDFSGTFCGEGKYPLISHVNELLNDLETSMPYVPSTKMMSSTKAPTSNARGTTESPASRVSMTRTTKSPPDAKSTMQPRTEKPETGGSCFAVGAFKGSKAVDHWCVINCNRGFCPPSHCLCSSADPPRSCRAKENLHSGMGPGNMDVWCQMKCDKGKCVEQVCDCDPTENDFIKQLNDWNLK